MFRILLLTVLFLVTVHAEEKTGALGYPLGTVVTLKGKNVGGGPFTRSIILQTETINGKDGEMLILVRTDLAKHLPVGSRYVITGFESTEKVASGPIANLKPGDKVPLKDQPYFKVLEIKTIK